ncbi:MAG: uroporphyrinogen decarboxylase, partial [Verrucomicrobia bacterium]|nr:uroporphyrinogen decarboxylase [Verrucomicrobiota bacterium]
MPDLTHILPGYYRIRLPAALSDSMHGRLVAFELNTVRLRDSEGAEGTGYTFTCGRNGSAIHALLSKDFPSLMLGQDADRIELLWTKLWWGLHYGGRGGPTVLALSAFDMALWDLKAKRLNQPLWKLLGGHNPRVSCYAGGIDLNLSLDGLLQQSDRVVKKGFHAIKMKVGRERLAEDVERIKAMREHLGE